MADTMAFNFRVLENGTRNYILQVNGADATTSVAATRDGQSTGILAANGFTPTTKFKVRRILYTTNNCLAQLQWHANTNVNLALLNGFGDINLTNLAGSAPMGIQNDGGAGVTGDIDLTSFAIAAVTGGAGLIVASMHLVIFGVKGT